MQQYLLQATNDVTLDDTDSTAPTVRFRHDSGLTRLVQDGNSNCTCARVCIAVFIRFQLSQDNTQQISVVLSSLHKVTFAVCRDAIKLIEAAKTAASKDQSLSAIACVRLQRARDDDKEVDDNADNDSNNNNADNDNNNDFDDFVILLDGRGYHLLSESSIGSGSSGSSETSNEDQRRDYETLHQLLADHSKAYDKAWARALFSALSKFVLLMA